MSDAATQYRISQRGAERMLRLAEFLDILPRERFDFSTTRKEWTEKDVRHNGHGSCGTVGCAIGWCPNALPEVCSVKNSFDDSDQYDPTFYVDGKMVDPHRDWVNVGELLFEIPYQDSFDLFTPWHSAPHDGTVLAGNASPKTVAQSLRNYVAWALVTPLNAPSNSIPDDEPDNF